MPVEYREAHGPDLVIVGSASRDIDAADPRGWRLGGGVTYASRVAAGLGLRVGAVIGLDAEAASATELAQLRALRVQLRPVPLRSGPVFENRETDAGRSQIAHSASDVIDPASLPVAWRRAAGFLFDPVAAELPDEWAGLPLQTALVALDLQGMVRVIEAGQPVCPRPLRRGSLVSRADLVTISAEDARGGAVDLATIVAREGQEMVVKHGERGGLHVYHRGGRTWMRRLPAVPARRIVDRTGAGDAFIAGWIVGRLVLRHAVHADARALHLAASLAALTVERTPVDRTSVRNRLAELERPMR